MDPNVFDKVEPNPMVYWDINNTAAVVNMLYELEGGDGLIQTKQNEERLIEIDRYYIAKYRAETSLLKRFIFFCCLALVGSVLYNKQIITLPIFSSYLFFISVIMVYVIGRDFINIFMRDSRNYDEFDFSIYYAPGATGNMYNTYNTAELSNIPSCPS